MTPDACNELSYIIFPTISFKYLLLVVSMYIGLTYSLFESLNKSLPGTYTCISSLKSILNSSSYDLRDPFDL